MGLVDINVTALLQIPPELTAALTALLKKGDAIMNDLQLLKEAMNKLEAKATETNATLAGLAQAVVDLKASGDVQAGIDELAAQAQRILDAQTAAEDAADDQLPETTPTP